MHPKTEIRLIKVLEEIASELNSINSNTSNINIELEELNSKDFYGDDCTSDIAKNVCDWGQNINGQLQNIVYCLDDEIGQKKG